MKWSILAGFSDFFDETFRLPSRSRAKSRADPGRVCQALAERSVLAERGIFGAPCIHFSKSQKDLAQPIDFPAGQIVACKYRANTGKQWTVKHEA